MVKVTVGDRETAHCLHSVQYNTIPLSPFVSQLNTEVRFVKPVYATHRCPHTPPSNGTPYRRDLAQRLDVRCQQTSEPQNILQRSAPHPGQRLEGGEYWCDGREAECGWNAEPLRRLCVSCVVKFCFLPCTCCTCSRPPLLLSSLLTRNATVNITFYKKFHISAKTILLNAVSAYQRWWQGFFSWRKISFSDRAFMVLYPSFCAF